MLRQEFFVGPQHALAVSGALPALAGLAPTGPLAVEPAAVASRPSEQGVSAGTAPSRLGRIDRIQELATSRCRSNESIAFCSPGVATPLWQGGVFAQKQVSGFLAEPP